MKTAALYIRVSTDEQAEKGFSQRHQEEMLRKYCEIKGILIFKVYFEDHSAKTFKRPVWNKLMVDLRKNKGQTDLVLFTKWDRFSRNTGDAYYMISVLRRFGIEPQAIEQPLDLTIPENKMMLAFYLAAPEVENDRRSLNVFYGQRRARKEGRWPAAAPVGYVNLTDERGNKYIALKEPHASAMRWAFEEIARRKFNLTYIFTETVAMGISCKIKNFYQVIRNPVYCGKVVVPKHQDEDEYIVDGVHEPLISEALFYEVQEVLKRGKKTGAKKVSEGFLPLRGFLQCPKCGKMLTGSASKGRKSYYYYYHCFKNCGTRHKAKEVNDAFITEMNEYRPKPGYEEFYAEIIKQAFKLNASGDLDGRRRIMAQIQELYDKINHARELALSGEFDTRDFRQVKLASEKEITVLESQLPEMNLATRNIEKTVTGAISNLYSVYNEYDSYDLKRQRGVIGSFFPEKLTFDGSKVRTARVNEIVLNIALINRKLKAKKNWTKADFSSLSSKVGVTGFEPVTLCL
jgi:DNA invertase Pin-like site-specific DNA recombinase